MASDYLLEIEAIKGESKDSALAGNIEILSWSWGASNPTSVGSSGLSGGKVSFSDLNIMLSMDKSVPPFLTYCAVGTHIPKAILHGRKSGDDPRLEYLTYTFEDLMVSSCQLSASDGGGIPTVSVSLTWSKYKLEYKEQKADGKLEAATIATYDLKLGKK